MQVRVPTNTCIYKFFTSRSSWNRIQVSVYATKCIQFFLFLFFISFIVVVMNSMLCRVSEANINWTEREKELSWHWIRERLNLRWLNFFQIKYTNWLSAIFSWITLIGTQPLWCCCCLFSYSFTKCKQTINLVLKFQFQTRASMANSENK